MFYPKGQKDVEQLAEDQILHSVNDSGASSELVDRLDAISLDSHGDNATTAQVLYYYCLTSNVQWAK